MREIKFRAWDKREHKMIMRPQVPVPCISESDLWILMQYTGLKDKNGKEIYERDVYRILRFLTTRDEENEFYIIKDFIEDTYFLKDLIDSGDTIEKIGNIYENPRLLEKK